MICWSFDLVGLHWKRVFLVKKHTMGLREERILEEEWHEEESGLDDTEESEYGDDWQEA